MARLVVSTTRLLPLEEVIEVAAPSTAPLVEFCLGTTREATAVALASFPTLKYEPAIRDRM